MRIEIKERLRPFSHVPGASCLLPKSGLLVHIFPALVRIEGFQDIPLELQGPMRDFTVMQDLEQGYVRVHGTTPQGYVCYFITQEEEGLHIYFEKFPFPKDPIFLSQKQKLLQPSLERLSLGMHKSQDWEMIRRRSDLKEIFPLWVKLGGFLPKSEKTLCTAGIFALLNNCATKIEENAKTELWEAFEQFFHAGFYSMLAPRLFDNEFQGLIPDRSPLPQDISPLLLIQKGAQLIRSLFFQERKDSLAFLPCLPPQFHSGRYLNLKTIEGDEIDLEWSKKLLKKAVLRFSSPRILCLCLQKEIKTFRLRTSLQDQGQTLAAHEPFHSASFLLLDRFQK